jgi:hypothetical protein
MTAASSRPAEPDMVPGSACQETGDAGEDFVGAALHRAGVLRLLAAALTYPTPERLGHWGGIARELAGGPPFDASLG